MPHASPLGDARSLRQAWLLFMFACLCAPCGAGDAALQLGPELIADGGFEASRGQLPAGWQDHWKAASVGEEQGATGDFCLQVKATRDNAAASTIMLPTKGNAKYLLAFDLKLAQSAGAFHLQFATYDQAKKTIKESHLFPGNLTYQSPVPEFAKVRYVYSPGLAGQGVAYIRIVFKWFGKPQGTAWIDNLSLREIRVENDGTRSLEKAAAILRGYNYIKARKDWFPFPLAYQKRSPASPVNVSYLLHTPAGKHGFVTAKDGHLWFADGTRARFLGGNIGWGGWRVDHAQAEKVADYLSRHGCNLVRFYIPDFKFTEEDWDKFDYLLHCFKQRGIYIYFYTVPGAGKGFGGFVPDRIQQQKGFWKKLLTHVNPHTKLPLARDPMLAFLFLCNETGIFHYVRRPGHVKGENLRVLTHLWNDWLLKTYGTRAGLQQAWDKMEAQPGLQASEDPAKASVPVEVRNGRKGRTYDYMRFCDALQRRYYREMTAYLHSLGVRVPIGGMNRPNTYHDFRAGAETGEITGDHYYWCHPRGPDVNETENIAMVRDVTPFSGLHAERGNRVFVGAACRGKVKGLPFGVGEWNSLSNSGDYRCEIVPIMASYAALHDWDFLCHFAFFHSRNNWDNVKVRDNWGSTFDPARMGLMPAAALIFLRHDVATARRVIERVQLEAPYVKALRDSPKDNIWEYLRVVAGLPPYRRLRPYYAYVSRVENVFREDPNSKADAVITNLMAPEAIFRTLTLKGIHPPDVQKTLCFVSDTQELVSNIKQGIFTVNSRRSQGAVGFLDTAGRIELADVIIDKCNTFATVILNALDDRPIARSQRVLLTIVGDADNTDEKRRVVANYSDAFVEAVTNTGVKRFHPPMYIDRGKWNRVSGHGPILVEPVEVEITLKNRSRASVFALSPEGERNQELPVIKNAAGMRFMPTGDVYKTIYYEIAFASE